VQPPGNVRARECVCERAKLRWKHQRECVKAMGGEAGKRGPPLCSTPRYIRHLADFGVCAGGVSQVEKEVRNAWRRAAL
jgi:hypothetical protein